MGKDVRLGSVSVTLVDFVWSSGVEVTLCVAANVVDSRVGWLVVRIDPEEARGDETAFEVRKITWHDDNDNNSTIDKRRQTP